MELVANFILNNESLDASFDVSEVQNFDALFEIYASGTVWGTIEGDITNQTDLQNILNGISGNIGEIETTVSDLQTTVSDNYSELNTKIQNEAATRAQNDSLLQGDINTLSDNLTAEISNRESADSGLQTQITNLTGTVSSNYNTLNNSISNLSNTVDDLSDTVDSNYNILDTKIDTTQTTLQGNINTLSGTVTSNYNDLTQSITNNVSTLNTRITNEVSTLNGAISNEATARANADNNLQTQIDAIVSSSDVFDIVGTYAELQAYDISTVPVNDIIKVLVDSTHNNAATYYRCVENAGVKSWSYIGSEGAYYTKGEADSIFVPQTRTINNKALNQNINLTASDVGALPVGTQIGNGTILLTQGGVQKGTFTLNQTGNATIDFDAVSEDITVDSELSTTSTNPVQNKVITGALNDKQDVLTAGPDLEIVEGSTVELPEGYTQLEYIQFTGTQYINTGILGNAGLETDVTFSFDEVPRDNSVLGSRVGGTRIYLIHIYQGWCIGYGSYYNTFNFPAVDVVYNVVTVLEAGKQTMTVNNFSVISRRDDTVYDTNIPLYLGAQSNASSAGGTITAQGFVKIKVYRIKIKSNGVLVFDGVPCKRGDIVGLYNTIADEFLLNSGTGSLIAGAEVPSSTVINFTNETGYTTNKGTVTSVNNIQPDASGNVTIETGGTVDQVFDGESENAQSGIAIQDALDTKQDTLTAGPDLEIVPLLPSDYTQLKSITATGSQYINTGLWSSDNFKAEIVGRFTSTTGTQCMLGATVRTSSATYKDIMLGKNASQYFVGNGSPWVLPNQTNSSVALDTNKHTFVVEVTSSTTKISVDGVENSANYVFSSIEENLYLFANNAVVSGGTSSAADFAQFELESIKLYSGDNLIFNGVPCKRGDIAGLYNTVSATFMPSLGSSAFVAGDEVVTQTIINFTNETGYITGIDSNDVTTALGYTPYNASNPNGYTSNVGTVTSVNGISPTNGNVAIIIPTVNNGTLTITQDGNTLGTFGANQSTNSTIDIPKSGSSRNIGEIVASTLPLTDAGLHLLDGALIQGDGIYADFVDYIAGLDLTANYFCTEAEWQQSITDYGVCGKFVYTQPTYQLIDTSSGTTGWYVHSLEVGSQVYATNGTPQITIASVSGNHITVTGTQAALFPSGFDRDTANDVLASVRLPKITSVIEGTTDLTALGDLVEAGLPNITGSVSSKFYITDDQTTSGVFKSISGTGQYGTAQSSVGYGFTFDASQSSSIYGNSTTVQPQTIKAFYYIVIATSIKTEVQVDIDNIATDLNSKADVDGSNINQSFSTNLVANMSDTANIYMSGMGMPSGRYINLTLGASGSTYTAPANGWYNLSKTASANGQWCDLKNVTNGFYISSPYVGSSGVFRSAIPVKKNDVLQISYDLGGATNFFRFYYAVGSESEAS